jgi:hypothetical protein
MISNGGEDSISYIMQHSPTNFTNAASSQPKITELARKAKIREVIDSKTGIHRSNLNSRGRAFTP